jgi:hypothetical protein
LKLITGKESDLRAALLRCRSNSGVDPIKVEKAHKHVRPNKKFDDKAQFVFKSEGGFFTQLRVSFCQARISRATRGK